MDEDDNASLRTVLRSRRPQSTPRNFMHENRETSEMPAGQVARRAAGEGLGRTARKQVAEESDSGVLPMNHSNKDGRPSAESEEGRLLIEENTHQLHTLPTQSGYSVPRKLVSVRQVAVGFAANIRDKSRVR